VLAANLSLLTGCISDDEIVRVGIALWISI